MKVESIPLERIKANLDNPNLHSDEKIATLAANIAEFGLIHPISVKPLEFDSKQAPIKYEIIAGEGRFHAFRRLWKDAKSSKSTRDWGQIPCVVVHDISEYRDWGRRLSENKLRSFNWTAECIELARMRDHGKSAKELAGLFGYAPGFLKDVAAIGFIPGLNKLAGAHGVHQESIISLKDARDYLLPLRVWPPDIPKNDKCLDYSLYDYTECVGAIDKLAEGSLSPSDLPAYSAERREAIARAQEQKRIESVAAQRLENIKAELSEKDKLVRKAEAEKARAVKEAQDRATADIDRARKETEKRIKENAAKLQTALVDLENAGSDKAEMQSMIHNLEEEKGDLERRLQDQAADMERMRDQIQAEIEERIRAEVIERLREEIQVQANEEAENELGEARKLSAEEMTKNSKERERLEKYHQRLVERERELEAEKERIKNEKGEAAHSPEFIIWFHDFQQHGQQLLRILGTGANSKCWATLGKDEAEQLSSICSGLENELRVMKKHLPKTA